MMRRIATLAVVLGIVALALACNDTFLKTQQDAVQVSVHALDAWFQLEKANAPEIEAMLPGSHATTEKLRERAPGVIHAVELAIDNYMAAQKAGADSTTMSQREVELRSVIGELQVLGGQASELSAQWAAKKGGAK